MSSQLNPRKLAVPVALALCAGYLLLYSYQTTFSYHQHKLPSFDSERLPPPSPPPDSAQDYSIKPVAYIFPQYYVFEDNNRLHGENFTEWVNVKKVTHNAFGLETIRPHESIGYYNGLEYSTRKRQGDFLRESGFYGAVFHHYWFAGRPVMDHVVKAMLEDGEPNIPFMLSWANEPWTARWEGAGGTGATLIAQEYGLHAAWRKHFDWLLPFFRHPQYIRSEGKVQFVVYNPMHIGHLGPHMFAAWRQWAVEEGLGGMDIIETRWGEESLKGMTQWEGHPPDAVNEFQPHAGGLDYTKFSAMKRLSRVYHRGTMACWDTTPRHPSDGRAQCLPACHPKPWQNHLVEMFRKIKSDPNPAGAENFFFVNALNEWGEGNAIEPSMQFGNGYGEAMKNAMQITEKEHVWLNTTTEIKLSGYDHMKAIMKQTADVCVMIQAKPRNTEGNIFKLSAMFRSLQAQNNQNWRAVVYEDKVSGLPTLDLLVLQALDERIRHITLDTKIDTSLNNAHYLTIDAVIKNLTKLDAGCASAKYLLITDGSNTYEKKAFDAISREETDFIGLNVESKNNIWDHPQGQNASWADRCAWLETHGLNLCSPTAPTLETFDLSATFINLPRFLQESHIFAKYTSHFPTQQAGALAYHLTTQLNWTFSQPSSSDCHMQHNPTYNACLKTGNFWFDSPIFEEMGCYTSSGFTEILGRKSPFLRDLDLAYFREHGTCIRYKEKMYEEAVKMVKAGA